MPFPEWHVRESSPAGTSTAVPTATDDAALDDAALGAEIDASLHKRSHQHRASDRRSSISSILHFKRGRKRSDAAQDEAARQQDRREHPYDVDAHAGRALSGPGDEADENAEDAERGGAGPSGEPIRMLVRKTKHPAQPRLQHPGHRHHHQQQSGQQHTQSPESVAGITVSPHQGDGDRPRTQAEVAQKARAPLVQHRGAAERPRQEGLEGDEWNLRGDSSPLYSSAGAAEASADPQDGTPASAPSAEEPDSETGPATEPVDLLAPSASERDEAAKEIRKQGAMTKEEYVWDVLFENQRGILFMGTPYFSSQLLLPFDPPAHTIPSHLPRPVPARPTTATSAHHSPPSHQAVDSARIFPTHSDKDGAEHPRHPKPPLKPAKQKPPQQSMRTPYTRETYQLPSTQWRWLTPWLINMRQDGLADERGWEYNYFFRTGREHQRTTKRGRGGWGCEVGRWGWGGWVRRRMWVRLRMLDRADMDRLEEGPGAAIGQDAAQSPLPSPSGERPAYVLESHLVPEDINVRTIVRAMSARPLDRQRLALWKEWIAQDTSPDGKTGDDDGAGAAHTTRERLKELLEDEDNAQVILGAVTYGSARSALLDLWKQQRWDITATAD